MRAALIRQALPPELANHLFTTIWPPDKSLKKQPLFSYLHYGKSRIKQHKNKGLKIDFKQKRGRVFHEMASLAISCNADLVIIGSTKGLFVSTDNLLTWSKKETGDLAEYERYNKNNIEASSQ